MTDLTAEMAKVQAETKKLDERNQLLEKVLTLHKSETPPPAIGLPQLVNSCLSVSFILSAL